MRPENPWASLLRSAIVLVSFLSAAPTTFGRSRNRHGARQIRKEKMTARATNPIQASTAYPRALTGLVFVKPKKLLMLTMWSTSAATRIHNHFGGGSKINVAAI